MWTGPLLRGFLEFRYAVTGSGGAEIGVAFGGRERYRAPVKIQRRFGLADVFERNGEVVGVIRIVGLQVMGLKKSLLGIGPAVLVDVGIAQREMQIGFRRVALNQLFDARFRRLRVGAAEHADQSSLRERVARVELEDFDVMLVRGVAIALLGCDGGEAEQRFGVARIAFQQLVIKPL